MEGTYTTPVPPRLPVVVPSAAGSPWLQDCLRTVRDQGAQTVYIVSEAAADGGTHIAVDASAGFAERANHGLRAAAEAGATAALLLNDDTRLLAGSLAAFAEAVQHTEVVGAVVLDWDGGRVQQAGIRVSSASGRVRSLTVPPSEPISPADAVGGTAMAIDLAAWERLGGFEERFAFYMEDVDYCLRARSAGMRVAVLRDARVLHRGGGTRSRHSPEAAYHLGRSHALLARRLEGGPLARSARLVCVGALGCGWTLKSVGPGGLAGFARGWVEGARI